MSFKSELYEQYVLSESKETFIKSLIPDSYEHLYFQVLHALNTKKTLSEEDVKVLTKLRNTYVHTKHEGYPLHNLDFQNLLQVLDSHSSTAAQRESALKDLKHYFNIRFNAVKPNSVQGGEVDPASSDQFVPQLETSLDQKIISFSNYLNQAYTNAHNLNNIVPQALYKMDVNKLLTEGKSQQKFSSALETFLSNVPCLHQVKDVPKIYQTLYEDYKSRKQIYDFSQAGYDRLSITQLKELGVLMKEVVFETKEYQLALIKKLFFREISKFLTKENTNLSQEEKVEKKKQYALVAAWAKDHLPKKLSYLSRLLTQELIVLSLELGEYNQALFLEFINNPPVELNNFTTTFREQYSKNNISSSADSIWNQVFKFTQLRGFPLQKTIEAYLLHFFKTADSIKPFDSILEERYLHNTFYKSKILSGQQEYITKSTSVLSKGEIETLVNSRHITILDSNNRYVKGNEQVKLQIETKNIQNLTVNIFEIKTENYYLQQKTAFDNTINLDGLIPLHTVDYSYSEPSNQAVLREFVLEPIQKATRGFFVVEFFGNSISSRAVFKKGLLTIVESPTIAGHLVTIIDENSNICKPADGGRTGIWYDERFLAANQDGHIIIPYSNSYSNPQLILVHNDFSEFESFSVQTEEYNFQCSYIYNQESFLQGNKSKIIIHPSLSINNVPANMAIIEDQLIKVSLKNHQDIPTALEFKDIKFDDKQDIEIEVPIQSIIKSLEIECSGVIKKMNGTKQNLFSENKLTFELHQVPKNQIFNLYLKKTDTLGYIVSALDKSGQPLEKVPISFQFQHKKIYQGFNASLQTDAEGRVVLGQLDNIQSITADVRDYKSFPNINQVWQIGNSYKIEHPSEISIIEDETIEIPFPEGIELNRENFTFYSIGQESCDFVYEDLFEKIKQNHGVLNLTGLKQGTYILHILELQTSITIKVYKGQYWIHNKSFLITDNTFIAVDRSNEKLISIKEALLVPSTEKEADILIHLNIPKSFTEVQRKKLRVHVFAFNFLTNDQDNCVANLRSNRIHKHLPIVNIQSTPANFFNNKKIGDEICYVYNRKNEQKRIGNTLEKPCVLLKRTFNRDTTFETETLDQGAAYSTSSTAARSSTSALQTFGRSGAACYKMSERMCYDSAVHAPGEYHIKGEIDTFLNFLNNPSFISSNHSVNEDGSVNVQGLQWENYASIQVIVSSNNVAISDIFPTTSILTSTQDLRHQSSMKSDQFYTENFSSGKLHATESLQISADSQTAIVGSIPELFEIQKTIMKTGRRTEEYQGRGYNTWQFLKEWNTLTDRQKLEKYNEFASHELNLFLFFKDSGFFKSVVEPFLKNKIQKTFIDFFLLGRKEEQLKYANTEKISELNILEQSLLILTLVKNNLKQRAESLAVSIENSQKTQTKNTDLQKRLFLTIIESSAKDEIAEARQLADMECLAADSISMKQCFAPAAAAPMMMMNKKMALRSSDKCKEEKKSKKQVYEDEEECDEALGGGFDVEGGDYESSLINQRNQFKEGYKNLEKTKEYIERQYYGDNQNNNYHTLVNVNKFWSDLVRYIVNHNGIENFVSENFIYAFNNHVEALSVLALMDISFSVRDNYDLTSLPGRKIQVLSRKNVLYFSKEIVQSSEISKANVSIIQTFFDPNDRYTTLKDDPTIKIEKEVEEFVINKIYGCKVIISNISIANLNLSVLTEIPEGSIPVNSFEYTKSIDISVNSYQTYNNIEIFFYFPKVGTFSIYRSNASRNGIIIAQANEIPPIVVKPFFEIKKMENLADILNNGSKEDILKFAKTQNLHDTQAFNVQKILYIIQNDKAFFLNFLEILREQGIFNRSVWEYSLHHNYEQGILELLNNSEFRSNRMIYDYHKIHSHQSDFLTYDRLAIFEYHPLLTSRIHSFMDQNKSKILNVQFKQSYFEYVQYLSHVAHLTSSHYLVLSYYLILQERIDEALSVFGKIKTGELENNSKIQYDYFAAYLDIYTGGPNFKRAREISEAYIDYPIISWRNLFVNLHNQLSEYDGEVLEESDAVDNTDLSKNLQNAEKEQSVTFEIQDKQLIVYYQNAEKAELNFYQLDIEVLFSTSPFMQGSTKNEFTFIKPNHSISLNFAKQNTLEKKVVDIPEAFANKNLNIQLVSSTGVQNLSYFSSSLKVQVIDKFGQVKVLDESNSPQQKVYVKCFAKLKDETTRFFRDGYTDLRGRFDYALSSGTDINQVKEFSILICSEEHGSVIKQSKPPTTSGRMETTVTLLKKK